MIILATFAFTSFAQARPDSTQLTCAEAADLVQDMGAVLMTYDHHPQAGPLYKRFVADSNFCGGDEISRNAWVKTSDSPRCFVGKTCESRGI